MSRPAEGPVNATRLARAPAVFILPMLRMRPRLAGFIEPCLPSPAPNPPAGDGWIHEIKLDGFRMLARRDGAGVRLLDAGSIGLPQPSVARVGPRLIHQSEDRPRSRQDNNGSA